MKLDKLDFIKAKDICASKDTIKNVKWQTRNCRKHLQLSDTTTSQLIHGQKINTDISSEKTEKLPVRNEKFSNISCHLGKYKPKSQWDTISHLLGC